MSIEKIIGWVAVGVITIIWFALVYTLPVWFLWNWLIPRIFGSPKLSILQSLGILLLTGFLFRGSYNTKND
jgi:hypothetical protein